MQTYQPSLFGRSDTLLGVCEAIGTDLGFNPNYLRIAFASIVFFNVYVAAGIYLAAGAVVFATRWAYPPSRKLMVVQPAAQVEAAPIVAENDSETAPLAVAA